MERDGFHTEKITWWHNPKMGWSSTEAHNEDFVKRESTVVIFEDKESGLFTMSLLERGGPIIVAHTLEEVKSKFMDAFTMTISIAALRGFSEKN